jgi:hypothetical protein
VSAVIWLAVQKITPPGPFGMSDGGQLHFDYQGKYPETQVPTRPCGASAATTSECPANSCDKIDNFFDAPDVFCDFSFRSWGDPTAGAGY